MQSVRVLGFDPVVNGLHFPNSFPAGTPDYMIALPGNNTWRVGDASNGLCGGFAYTVRDCFQAGLLPPAETVIPAEGSALFCYLVARLTDSFGEGNVNQYVSWTLMSDGDTILGAGISTHEIREEWPRIKADLDANTLCPLGLVSPREPAVIGVFSAVGDLGNNHQVLAWGYDLNGTALTIHIYDPDHAGDQTITLDIGHPGQVTPLHVTGWADGHFRGFFRSNYTFHDPRTPASGAFVATVVTSPGITSAGPVSRPWTMSTWQNAGSSPLVRFTGSVHEWSQSFAIPPADVGRLILQLHVEITTGGDDLRAGGDPTGNCDAVLTLATGATVEIPNINNSQSWPNNSFHTVVLPLPAGLRGGDVAAIELKTSFGGGLGGDNWNVNAVRTVAALTGPATVVAHPPPSVTRTWLAAGGSPLVRFTGSVHDWASAIAVAAADANRTIEALALTVKTGGDDLRGGSGAGDNATVELTFREGVVTSANINGGAHWNNNDVHTVGLSFPAGAKAGDLSRFDLHTQFGGGLGGDNWNVNELTLVATLSG